MTVPARQAVPAPTRHAPGSGLARPYCAHPDHTQSHSSPTLRTYVSPAWRREHTHVGLRARRILLGPISPWVARPSAASPPSSSAKTHHTFRWPLQERPRPREWRPPHTFSLCTTCQHTSAHEEGDALPSCHMPELVGGVGVSARRTDEGPCHGTFSLCLTCPQPRWRPTGSGGSGITGEVRASMMCCRSRSRHEKS